MIKQFTFLIICWLVSYVLGVKRAGECNFVGATNNRPSILKDRQFEFAGFTISHVLRSRARFPIPNAIERPTQ